MAHLRNGDPFTRLAAGFGVGTATAWRYVREAIALLTAAADDLTTAMTRIRRLAYAILDGTVVPIDRVADQKPYYSGKHKRHGVNVQVIADPAGRLGLGLTGPARRRPRHSDQRCSARNPTGSVDRHWHRSVGDVEYRQVSI